MTSDTASVSSGSSQGSHPFSKQRPTHQPIIEVETLTEEHQNQFVGLDCEMVGVGANGKISALARVTMIDWWGDILMDEYVKQDQEVTDYRTSVSGITPDILKDAKLDWITCKHQVEMLLEGKMLVGHALKNDLRVLGVTHPWYMTRDTAKYEPFMKVRFDDGVLWPRSLKDLCQEKLSRNIQVDEKPHCPQEDALAALDLYRSVRGQWERTMEYKVKKTRAIEKQQQQQQRRHPQ